MEPPSFAIAEDQGVRRIHGGGRGVRRIEQGGRRRRRKVAVELFGAV